MKDLRNVILFVLVVALVPVLTSSGVVLNFLMTALYACLLAQAWNILGGFGGQFSFGHALFFGTGAYAQAILQLQFNVNAWVALPLAMAFAMLPKPIKLTIMWIFLVLVQRAPGRCVALCRRHQWRLANHGSSPSRGCQSLERGA